MKTNFIITRLLVLTIIITARTDVRADSTYIKFGAVWKYLDKGTAAPIGSGATDWRNITFNDAGWKTGPAELGYRDNKERITVSYGANPVGKHITGCFSNKL